jgi:mono/diheme cytochrome c family protein
MKPAFAALVSLILAACSTAPEPGTEDGRAAAATTVSLYRSDIAPMLAAHCATCHLTGQEAGNVSLVPDKAVATLVGTKAAGAPALIRVVPGKPDESYLIMKLEGTQIEHGGAGSRMPFGAPPLSPDKIAKLRQWISEGAKG